MTDFLLLWAIGASGCLAINLLSARGRIINVDKRYPAFAIFAAAVLYFLIWPLLLAAMIVGEGK